ncbi:MAG: sensor histidine kinase [Pelagerythrobacter marensis]|nr:MAG: sensor histidine kinase [Pelagerythrobacter marensis]
MNAPTTSLIARGTTDGHDRLLSADGPLADLQWRCGGELPGTVAIPELLELVAKARRYGLKLARNVQAFDGEHVIRAWVEVKPDPDTGGCTVMVTSWQATDLPAPSDGEAAARSIAIDRQQAELAARLDQRQNLLAVLYAEPALASLGQAMRAGPGRPWTDFVALPGLEQRQPMHWRLLDGASVAIEGSPRSWRARVIPLGEPVAGSSGFELLLVSDQPPTAAEGRVELPAAETSLGRDLAPALRQPIARIVANAETIRTKLAGPLDDQYSAYAADISSAAQHLLALLDDLADLEIVESDGFITQPDQIDLADVARRATGILGMRAQEKGIDLILPPAGSSLRATGEFRRVLQVLLNLLGNAISYSAQRTQVALTLSETPTRACITVSDQGPGIPADQHALVFDKFERLGRSGDGGSGLGLYISHRLAQAMGGELTLESAPGEGARFTLALPKAN